MENSPEKPAFQDPNGLNPFGTLKETSPIIQDSIEVQNAKEELRKMGLWTEGASLRDPKGVAKQDFQGNAFKPKEKESATYYGPEKELLQKQKEE